MEVDFEALRHNYQSFRASVGFDLHLIPALKGNAMGHGTAAVARLLAEFDVHLFAVSNLDDAKAIRGAGIDLSILMLGVRSPIVISDPLGIDWEATRIRRAGESADVGYLLEESA